MSIINCRDVDTLLLSVEKGISEGSLLIWDCDGVLRLPKRKYMHLLEHSEELQKMLGDDPDEIWNLASHAWNHGPGVLVDVRIRDKILDLQKQGIRSLVLTQLMTGKIGPIDDAVKWRNDDLRNLGYDFAKSWRDIGPFDMKTLPRDPNERMSAWGLRSKRTPRFDSGIIYASYANKGDVLEEFLIKTQLSATKIKNIIYVDDKASKIRHIENACNKIGTGFCGIYFAYAEEELMRDPASIQKARDAIRELKLRFNS